MQKWGRNGTVICFAVVYDVTFIPCSPHLIITLEYISFTYLCVLFNLFMSQVGNVHYFYKTILFFYCAFTKLYYVLECSYIKDRRLV